MKKYNIFLFISILVLFLSGCEAEKHSPVTVSMGSNYVNFHANDEYLFKDIVMEEQDDEISISFKAYIPKE